MTKPSQEKPKAPSITPVPNPKEGVKKLKMPGIRFRKYLITNECNPVFLGSLQFFHTFKGIESFSPGLASPRDYPGIRCSSRREEALISSARNSMRLLTSVAMGFIESLNPERVASPLSMSLGPLLSNGRGTIAAILFALLSSTAALRADLILEQQSSDTNGTHTGILKLHGDKMRLDQPDNGISVIVDLKSRDSITLLTSNKTYLNRFGSEVRWQMDEERKYTHGTNDLDFPPARPVDTGKSETVNGRVTEIFTWSGVHGLKETLWVATNFPNYDAIRAELIKLDRFNDSGPHRNAQPELSLLPGMVMKSESLLKGHTLTTTLVSVKMEPVDASLFVLPKDYSPWERQEKKAP